MSMHDVTTHLNKALADRGQCVRASMNYLEGGKRELFKFAIDRPEGQVEIEVPVPAMTSVSEIALRACEALVATAP